MGHTIYSAFWLCLALILNQGQLSAQPISMTEVVSPGPREEMTTKGVRLQPTGKPDEKKPEVSLMIADIIKKQREARSEGNVGEEKKCLMELIRLDPNNPAYLNRLKEIGGMSPKAEPIGRLKIPAPTPTKPSPYPVTGPDLTRYEWSVENIPLRSPSLW